MPFQTLQAPGFYPGSAQATLLNMNRQAFLWQNMRVLPTQASVAVQLSRMPRIAYPFGAAFQVKFSAAPGAFELDIEGAEEDVDGAYISVVTIIAVNASNYGRASVGFTYPKFCRGRMVTLTNDVLTTLEVTR